MRAGTIGLMAAARRASRTARALRGLRLRVTTPSWWDLCQIGDAAFEPFVQAVASRGHQSLQRVLEATEVRTGVRLSALCEETGAVLGDTGLRVLGRPVWRLGNTATYVFEAMPGGSVLLVCQTTGDSK